MATRAVLKPAACPPIGQWSLISPLNVAGMRCRLRAAIGISGAADIVVPPHRNPLRNCLSRKVNFVVCETASHRPRRSGRGDPVLAGGPKYDRDGANCIGSTAGERA